jgi:hypothetical protein
MVDKKVSRLAQAGEILTTIGEYATFSKDIERVQELKDYVNSIAKTGKPDYSHIFNIKDRKGLFSYTPQGPLSLIALPVAALGIISNRADREYWEKKSPVKSVSYATDVNNDGLTIGMLVPEEIKVSPKQKN